MADSPQTPDPQNPQSVPDGVPISAPGVSGDGAAASPALSGPQGVPAPTIQIPAAAPSPQGVIPPLPPGAMPQLGAAMLGIQIGQPQQQQNPIVMQHICTYLAHGSDNRLAWYQDRGKQSHRFRMAALGVVSVLAIAVLAIPLVALARGDMAFVTAFLDKYMTEIIMVALALLGGGKLFDLLK